MRLQSPIDEFDKDAVVHGGYVYTTTTQLSSRLATSRTIDAIVETGCLKGRSVLDMGCGDGYFTARFWDLTSPRRMIGVDAAAHAIKAAHARKGDRPIEFSIVDAHHLPWADDSFELVMIQSTLHHDDDPGDLLREALRVAPLVLVHEPNGNNIGLKIIERLSRYHRTHREKSYSSFQFERWVRQAGGRIIYRRFAGFVPMFCPDGVARLMKRAEPVLERVPVLRDLVCSVVVFVAERSRQA